MIMKIYTQNEREMIQYIVELLSTFDEAFVHINLQVDELRLEESHMLFKDTIEALEVVVASSVVLLVDQCGMDMIECMGTMREALGQTIDAYEDGNIVSIQWALEERLLPAFHQWRDAINLLLIPTIAS